jgi:anti-sigma-K factor RskA
LLGSLNDDRQKQVEERLITDADFFEELEIAEDELIDEFLSHDLSEPERDRFERHFLAAPERQRNLQFAKAMRRQITPQIAPPPLVPWWSLQNYFVRAAAAVAVVTILAGLMVFRTRTAIEPTFANLTLTISDGDRSTGAPVTKAKRNVDELRVTLKLPEGTTPAAGYRVELTTAREAPKTLKILQQDGQSVSVVIPTNKLSPVLYSIKLYTINAAGTEQRVNGDYFLGVE